MVTPGALSAAAIVAQAFTGPRDRVLVESPVYPNAIQAIRHAGARLTGVAVDPDGWDLDARRRRGASGPAAAGLPDPRLPEPHRPRDDRDRSARAYARHLQARRHRRRGRRGAPGAGPRRPGDAARRSRRSPRTRSPSAAPARPSGAGCGSAGSGRRTARWTQLTRARVGLDLGAPVMEQLVLARLLDDARHDRRRAPPPTARAARPAGRRARRAPARVALPAARPAGWRMWCELPGRPRHRASPTRPTGSA